MSSPWRRRAAEAWDRLAAVSISTRRGRVFVHDPTPARSWRRRTVPVWPFSQVLHATVATGVHHRAAGARVPDLLAALETYRRGAAYAELPRAKRRYYDDNAWIALALLEHGDAESRAASARVLGFLVEGCDVAADGSVGVRWVEGGTAHHACSTGSTGLVAARLVADDPSVRNLAEACADYMLGLRDADGLVADHRTANGHVDPNVFTYNQGLLIGLLAELGCVDEAAEHAVRTIGAFGRDRLWAHSPAFNGILVRELMTLHRVAPDDRWTTFARDYLDRVWHEARDPVTGLFVAGGIGRYDDQGLLDHSGLVVAFSTFADVDD